METHLNRIFFFPSKDYIKMGTRLVPLGFTDCSAAPCWQSHPKCGKNCLAFSFSTFFLSCKSWQIWQRLYCPLDETSLLWVFVPCVDACVHTAACEQPLGTTSEREGEGRRESSIPSRPQAELSIYLFKVQGYRWVTKPPLITNHFCHESRFGREEAKRLYQTKNSDRVYTASVRLLTLVFMWFMSVPVLFTLSC